MPSIYSKNLGLELVATGEQAGTWGDTTNKNMAALDDSIDGIVDVIVGTDGFTLVTNDVPAISAGRSKVVNLTGTPNPNAVITVAPADVEKWYYIRNATGQPLRFQQGTGSTYTVAAGYSAVIHCDGTGIAANVFGTLLSLQVNRLLVRVDAAIPGSGSAVIEGAATITGGVTLSGAVNAASLTVSGAAQFNGSVGMAGTLGVSGAVTFGTAAVTIGGPTQINSNLGVSGTLGVSGAVTFGAGAVNISGATTIHSSLAVQSVAVTIGGITTTSLTVSGATALAATTAASLVVSGATETGTFTCHGQANIAGIAVTTFSAGNATFTTASAGTLTVTGATTLAGTTIGALTVSGATTLSGGCGVTGNVDASGSVISRAAMYIEAGVYIKLGADAVYDMYYRETAGQLARLPKGASGQFLRTASGGWPYWGAADALPAPTLAMGTPITGGVHSHVLYNYHGAVVGGSRLTFDFDANAVLTVSGHSSGLVLTGTEAINQAITFQAAGVSRFQLGISTSGPYGNANFYIVRCADDGVAQAANFMIARATGRILMGGVNQPVVPPSPGHLPGAVNIQPNAADEYGLCVRRAGAQTAHMQVWQDEGGNNLSWITKDGVFSGAAGNVNWVNMNKTTSYSLGSNVNVGALFFYAAALGAAGGYLSFQYGLGGTGGSLYMPLPTTGGTGITTGLTWMYRNGNNAPLAQTFEEYRHDSALGVVDNILAHADVVEKLKAALLA